MTITDAVIIPLNPDTRHGQDTYLLVEIMTDAGISGWGSCYSSTLQCLGAFEWLKPHLLGENPLEADRLTEQLHQRTFWVGRGGGMTHAISGINIALWDILGKATGQRVSVLLGGNYRTTVKPYASILFQEPPQLRDTLQRIHAQGFRAVKLGWGRFGRVSLRVDEELVSTARETLGGDVEIMIDAGGSAAFWPWNAVDAAIRARMLDEYDVTWFEEPLPPDDLEGYVELRARSAVKVASGEVLTRRQTFNPWLDRRAVDIIQPDSTKVGGLSESRRIGWTAEANNITLVPHGWNTAVGVAADIHLVCALPNAKWVEFFYGSPYIDDLLTTPFALDADGMLPLPDGPGLGVTVDRESVARIQREHGEH